MQPHTRHESRNNTRHLLPGLLNAALADAIDLALMTKQAHWNARGPDFFALHQMFDQFRDSLDTHVDAVAERIVQLGAVARGTSQSVVNGSTLAPYPTDIQSGEVHLAELRDRYADVASAARDAIDKATQAGDAGSADLLTDFSRALDRMLWMLDAHLHGTFLERRPSMPTEAASRIAA